MKKINLWNTDVKRNSHKTKNVINYIESLREPKEKNEYKNFVKIKEKALSQTTANKMLAIIGFNLLGEDKIYKWCSNERK